MSVGEDFLYVLNPALTGRTGRLRCRTTWTWGGLASFGAAETPDLTSTDNGAKVEVFADEGTAKSRADYIGQLAKSTPLAAEYDYQAGTAVVRVSKNLAPDQAAQYQQALSG